MADCLTRDVSSACVVPFFARMLHGRFRGALLMAECDSFVAWTLERASCLKGGWCIVLHGASSGTSTLKLLGV